MIFSENLIVILDEEYRFEVVFVFHEIEKGYPKDKLAKEKRDFEEYIKRAEDYRAQGKTLHELLISFDSSDNWWAKIRKMKFYNSLLNASNMSSA